MKFYILFTILLIVSITLGIKPKPIKVGTVFEFDMLSVKNSFVTNQSKKCRGFIFTAIGTNIIRSIKKADFINGEYNNLTETIKYEIYSNIYISIYWNGTNKNLLVEKNIIRTFSKNKLRTIEWN